MAHVLYVCACVCQGGGGRGGFLCLILLCCLLSQSEFCSDKPKSGAKYGVPEYLTILTEMGEVTDGLMDSKVSEKVQSGSASRS